MSIRACFVAAVAFAVVLPGAALGADPAVPPALERIARPEGATVLPERFLRRWDAVTVFLPGDVGPAAPAPESDPGRFAAIEPEQPGAWTWLGPRVLQFRPAVPWTPLGRVTIRAGAQVETRVVALPSPTRVDPPGGARGIPSLDSFAIEFAEPVDAVALHKQVSVEIRPAPGLDATAARLLDPSDYVVKAVERASTAAHASYVVQLKEPIPEGRVVTLRLRLTGEPGLDDVIDERVVATAEPFRLRRASCAGDGFTAEIESGVMRCRPDRGDAQRRALRLSFSAPAKQPDLVVARTLLRFEPPIDDLAVRALDATLVVTGAFRAGVPYALRLSQSDFADRDGRALVLDGGEPFRFVFEGERPSLSLEAGAGIVERLGPQMVPLRSRGFERVDLRIFAIDPLSRDFWPWPRAPIAVDEDIEPPLPGREPERFAEGTRDIGQGEIAKRIGALGSPAVAAIVELPTRRGGALARSGLDLKPHLARIAGPDRPGTYLVGVRRLDGSTVRDWMRIQVTDLVLSTVEEAGRVHFLVTSLSRATPVAGAEIVLEGPGGGQVGFGAVANGRTDAAGSYVWQPTSGVERAVSRVAVRKGDDVLVLDALQGPPRFRQQRWDHRPGDRWLAWTTRSDMAGRTEKAQTLCHLFTERPIYRPEDKVHIKGFARTLLGGALSVPAAKGTLVVTAPGGESWRQEIALSASGSVHWEFDKQTQATGDYKAELTLDGAGTCAEAPFKKEAYRLPTFEVVLDGPQVTPLDRSFSVSLAARYFAGGVLVGRPLKWRVSQFPLAWTPPGQPGFLTSNDSRFAKLGAFEATPMREVDETVADDGSAHLSLNPAIEATAQPRRYMVEATVTGDDDIQVRSTFEVRAVPRFALGVKVPRYVEGADRIAPEIAAIGYDGKLVAGEQVTVKLLRRTWTSTLQASDFSQGSAKYVTEMHEETVAERVFASREAPERLELPVGEASVYVVQAEALDRLGRKQSVAVDLFVAGRGPVGWSRPPSEQVELSLDRESYAPGETATVVVQSPFKEARALAVVEEPGGTMATRWVDVRDGFGRFEVPIRKEMMPRLPVHVLLHRGRVAGSAPSPAAPFDLGKPTTLAASRTIAVRPVEHQAALTLVHQAKARPGEEIDVTLRLADARGRPLSGEATFWMIDQAVLSLAKERPLDPLPSFVRDRPSRFDARDSRNLAFGVIPLAENAGGDGDSDAGALEGATVRKNFSPMPIFLPAVAVGPSGEVRIKVKLPDSLTNFKLRAKAVSGPDRFGFAVGDLAVRQPIVAQPALPRFLRPGDVLEAGLVARIVEGELGAGRATLKLDGLAASAGLARSLQWEGGRPQRVDFGVTVPQPGVRPDGQPARRSVSLQFGVERTADKARDDVLIELPLRPDRRVARQRRIAEVPQSGTLDLGELGEPAVPGTISRRLVVAADPAVPRLVSALRALVRYPHLCTEQRVSRLRVLLAVERFASVVDGPDVAAQADRELKDLMTHLAQAIDDDGLVGYWPRSTGYVSLTAWTLQFLAEARDAGKPIDERLLDRLAGALERSLRSDYARLVSGAEIAERTFALVALVAAKRAQPAYLAEILRRTDAMSAEAVASVAIALARSERPNAQAMRDIRDKLWGFVQTRSQQGQLLYAGLRTVPQPALILPSEARALARVARGLTLLGADADRIRLVTDALVNIGTAGGWGSTNSDAEAVLALSDRVSALLAEAQPFTLTVGGARRTERLTSSAPVFAQDLGADGRVTVAPQGKVPLYVKLDASWLPAAPGNRADAVAEGLAVSRQMLRVPSGGGPLAAIAAEGDDHVVTLAQGDVVEHVVEVALPEGRVHVAIEVPVAAGLEMLNPALATAPAEATPSAADSTAPTFVSMLDDRVLYYFDQLGRGTHRFLFRTRAQSVGRFVQPPATAELMYAQSVNGRSAGALVAVTR
ncbi:MAG: alpha-2-macroglobulin [Alphaproteobacteria bacterium]|nr:alpha-2-macroglobulin [Alphaproteobacteria bacterium]